MLLSEFVGRFSDLSEAEFAARFAHPFLVEDDEQVEADRRIFLVRGGRGVALQIGRGPRCHIPIKDKPVSTKHAELLPPDESEGWRIVDRGSTNGSWLDGEPLVADEPRPLVDGATIRFGPAATFQFFERFTERFFEDLRIRAGRSALKLRSTRKTERKTDKHEVEDEPRSVRQSTSAHPEGELLLTCEAFDPIPLDAGVRLVLGRTAKKANIVVPDNLVSRQHAEIERRPDGIFVRDLGSSNGTFLGAHRLGVEWERLPIGQSLTLGTHELFVVGPQSGDGLRDTGRIELGTLVVHKASNDAITIDSGDLVERPMPVLLGTIEDDQLTGVLEVRGAQTRGRIGFEDGQPRDASTSEGLVGLEALRRMLLLKQGSYVVTDAEPGARQIEESFAKILEEFLTGSGAR